MFDDKATGELFRRYGPMVYRRANRLLGNRDDAQEATQEVFIRVLRSAEGDRSMGRTAGWLAQITTHYCLNQLRDTGRRRTLLREPFSSPDELREAATPDPGDLSTLRYLLANADERQATAAIYVYLDGMSYSEAAELLGVSKRTVGNLLERFREWAEIHVATGGREP